MLLALLLLAAAPNPLVEQAAAAYAQKDAETCGKLVQDALQSGTLGEDDTARAWSLRGACFVLAGDVDRGERSYSVALRVRRDLAPIADAAFPLALKALPSPAEALALHAHLADADTIELELTADDLQLVQGAYVMRGDEEVARVPLELAHARHRVSGIGSADLVVFLVDKHGNTLCHQAVSAEPEHIVTPAPASAGNAPGVLTTLGATALGAGIVGIVASGIGVASVGPTALQDGQLWLVGVGASTGLFLVGATLVVIDQGL